MIEQIKINNYKNFKDLEVENLGNFNLIVGDNNIGKTNLLEALLFRKDSLKVWLSNLHISTYCARGNHLHRNISDKGPFANENYLKSIIGDEDSLDIFVNNEKISLSVIVSDSVEVNDFTKFNLGVSGIGATFFVKLQLNNEVIDMQPLKWQYTLDKSNLPYNVPFSKPSYRANCDDSEYKIHDQLSDIQDNEEQKIKLVNYLRQIMLPNLKDIYSAEKNGKKEIRIKLDNVNEALSLTVFGDGTLHFIHIILELFLAIETNVSILCLDEVDSGIHFTRLKSMWSTLLRECYLHNIQLFCTSHSFDCVKAYYEALKDLPDSRDLGRIIKLYNTKEQVKSITHNYDGLEFDIENDQDIRLPWI